MSKEVIQFVEMVREHVAKTTRRVFFVLAHCEGCGLMTQHRCEESGEWENRQCTRCGWLSSYRVR